MEPGISNPASEPQGGCLIVGVNKMFFVISLILKISFNLVLKEWADTVTYAGEVGCWNDTGG